MKEGQDSGHGYVYILPIGLTQPDCLFSCTDPNAENYNESATNDDGSCVYIGCMDELACNFNPQASSDDGSCAYKIDCMGVCGGLFIEDACENYDPNAIVELDQETFNYSGSIENYIVPEKYYIFVYWSIWAQGGGSCSNEGGYGAMMSGEIEVFAGQELQILVGGAALSVSNAAGGGGGSFVVSSDNTFNYCWWRFRGYL